jgi:hypothetical protein
VLLNSASLPATRYVGAVERLGAPWPKATGAKMLLAEADVDAFSKKVELAFFYDVPCLISRPDSIRFCPPSLVYRSLHSGDGTT